MYQAAVFNNDVEKMIGLLSETVLYPQISEEEVDLQKQTAAYEIREIWSKPELILPELLHTVAYQNQTLGSPLLCPEERLAHINAETIRHYRNALYRPERIVLAFAGLSHKDAVRMATEHFGDMKESSIAASTANSSPMSQNPNTFPHLRLRSYARTFR
jgi:processing peptidase subunit alpha